MITAATPVATHLHPLILARLLVPRKNAYTLAVLAKDLQPFCHGSAEQAAATLAAAVHTLIEESKIIRERKRLTLSEAGTVEALHFLGLPEMPANLKWDQCLNSHVLPRLLEIDTTHPKERKKLAQADGLCAVLLKREHHLPLSAVPSLSEALTMVLCRELGVPPVKKVNTDMLCRWLIHRINGERRHLSGEEDFARHLLFALVGGSKADLRSLRKELIAQLLQPTADTIVMEEPAAPEPPFNLSGFAEAVLEAARACPTGKLGDNKVLIHHVWKQMEATRIFPHLNYPAFQQHLIAANQEGLLQLIRLDLVDLFPPAAVAASETRYHHAVFHLVQM